MAYNVNNNLDKVLPTIVCTVDYGNMFNRSRFLLELKSFQALHQRTSGGKSYTQGKYAVYIRLVQHFFSL